MAAHVRRNPPERHRRRGLPRPRFGPNACVSAVQTATSQAASCGERLGAEVRARGSAVGAMLDLDNLDSGRF